MFLRIWALGRNVVLLQRIVGFPSRIAQHVETEEGVLPCLGCSVGYRNQHPLCSCSIMKAYPSRTLFDLCRSPSSSSAFGGLLF